VLLIGLLKARQSALIALSWAVGAGAGEIEATSMEVVISHTTSMGVAAFDLR
jgi:hypothetical protein